MKIEDYSKFIVKINDDVQEFSCPTEALAHYYSSEVVSEIEERALFGLLSEKFNGNDLEQCLHRSRWVTHSDGKRFNMFSYSRIKKLQLPVSRKDIGKNYI